jgi:hypothetical protein
VPTQGPARGSDERLREEQIDADERLREEQTRPMSGLLPAVPNDVCPRVSQDAGGVGMVMAAGAGAGIEVFVPGISATGVGGPVKAGRADRRTEVGEQAHRAGEDAVEVPAQGDGGGGSGTSGRSPLRSVRRMSARLPSSLRNPAALCSPVLRSISVPCESMIETARHQTSVPGCGRRFVHCSAFGGARPCRRPAPRVTVESRETHQGHQHRQAARGGKITDTRMGQP